ncbi:hypothetical protein WJX74_006948 [Apatococcus lobatus]|uniref:Uncharacterized protein n=2 Tax=Apatococcus TaxID=904362 RepID=A0AAW1S4G0_9CHLO
MHLRSVSLLSFLTANVPRLTKLRTTPPAFAAAQPSSVSAGGLIDKAADASSSTRLYSLSGNAADTMTSKNSAQSASAVVVYVTVPDDSVAKSLASTVVVHKLAACVSIIPGIQSVYWWEKQSQH